MIENLIKNIEALVAKEITDLEAKIEESAQYDPKKNPNAISIIKQPDGNYKGSMQKNGSLIEVREVGPETVVQQLITKE